MALTRRLPASGYDMSAALWSGAVPKRSVEASYRNATSLTISLTTETRRTHRGSAAVLEFLSSRFRADERRPFAKDGINLELRK
ncbi:MAG: hypothetical protein COZ06_37815 [Armatimonadetes bacterium CG_4_10_14_3_um_filter_66_18]|nr:MAG: hypothetical protein COS65_06285 [Armatimonadetes bacterium CG06_land_8_20_14_3_00_66_21]PIX41529.1 MAG: hypothetical protein COZ57_23210 [Armatimonadetes bacterium CG_4_8_14_3_um_filter_66_20]PIY35651.1 MAG: hypothetical protein COZ06_37815 [Armatimonadetes bacterium CG_4_10_14_3_um_filter_66_18]